MTITAVLLVPDEGDPHHLLAEGPCGAMPPMVHRHPSPPKGYEYLSRWTARGAVCGDRDSALVLAWEGKVVVEGMDRFRRAQPYPPSHYYFDIGSILPEVRAIGAEGIVGTIILLDAEGREVPS